MTRLEALINGIKDLETPENTKTIKKLTEGITLMAHEYRRRKAAETKAITEAKGFAELDELRKRSGLSDRAFLEGVGNDIIKSTHPDEVKQKLMNKLSDYSNYLTESANGGAGPKSAFGEKLNRVGKSALAAGMVAAAPFISGCAGNQYATHHPRTIEEIDAEIARLKAQIAERESPCSRSTPEYQAAKYDYIMNSDRSGLDAYAARCNHGSRNTPEYRAAMNDWVMNGDRSGLH